MQKVLAIVSKWSNDVPDHGEPLPNLCFILDEDKINTFMPVSAIKEKCGITPIELFRCFNIRLIDVLEFFSPRGQEILLHSSLPQRDYKIPPDFSEFGINEKEKKGIQEIMVAIGPAPSIPALPVDQENLQKIANTLKIPIVSFLRVANPGPMSIVSALEVIPENMTRQKWQTFEDLN